MMRVYLETVMKFKICTFYFSVFEVHYGVLFPSRVENGMRLG